MWQELITDSSGVTCARCDHRLPTNSHLIAHLKYHHDLRRTKCVYECYHCGKICSRVDNLDKHLWLHQPANFRCSECPATFRRPDYLTSHLRRVHKKIVKPSSEHKCKICEKVFTSAFSLAMHSVVHSIPVPSCYCQMCQRQFPNFPVFRIHMSVFHTSVKKTSSESNEPETFRCARCDQTFPTKAHLLAHLKWVHDLSKNFTKPTVYICHVCGKVCSRVNRFEQHLLIHNERTISCTLCRSKFKRPDKLQRHLKLYHHELGKNFEKPKHVCTVCERTFKTAGCLTLHSAFHKPPRFPCDICGKKLVNPSLLRNHMDVHMRFVRKEIKHKCPFCTETFLQRKVLGRHKQRIHSATFEDANRNFRKPSKQVPQMSIMWRMPTTWSTDKIAYVCAICCRPGFTGRSNISNHLRYHYRTT